MIRKLLVIALVLVMPVAVRADDAGAKQFVTTVNDKVFSIINSQASDAEKEQQLAGVFDQYADSDWMAMFVAGKYGRDLQPEQKTRYLKLYHDYLKANYVPRFKEYSGKSYEVERVQEKGKETAVYVKLKSAGKADISAQYLLHKANGGYKVVDLSGEGVSLITTQRSDFGGLIGSKGWNYFLEKLESKVKALSN